jgi:PTS system fructose-specific IIC component
MKLVAITNCPTGIAHTYMAAEALEKAAKELGVTIKVETQGSVGVENELTTQEINEAHAVIIASGVATDMSRFKNKTVIEWPVNKIIKEAKKAVQTAVGAAEKSVDKTVEASNDASDFISAHNKTGILKHLFTGISYMIPIVASGGLLIALSFLWGLEPAEGSLGGVLNTLGGAALSFMLPIMCAFIAYSIADRPGIAPGLALGYISANVVGAGFLGAIVAGLACGYLALYLKKIKLPQALQGINVVLFIPLITTIVVGLLMIYLIGAPIESIMTWLTNGLNNLSTVSSVLLGVVMGLMTAFDMGGPFDKVAYTFSVGLLASGITAPMAANMAAGMSPALGLALATVLFRKRFTPNERESGKVAWALGACFITEGAIPFAAADPLRILPATMLGSAVAGGLSMLFGCTLAAPHGGIFAIAIPGVVGNVGLYLVAIAAGAIVTAVTANYTKMIGKKAI